jgi:hypothetical protein
MLLSTSTDVACILYTCSELAALPTVPLLSETLSRLVLPPSMQQHVDYLKNDRDHGAAQLAAYVVQAFREQHQLHHREDAPAAAAAAAAAGQTAAATAAAGSRSAKGEGHSSSSSGGDGTGACNMVDVTMVSGAQLVEQLRDFGFHMAVCRPSMAAIANAAAAVLLRLKQELSDICCSRGKADGDDVGGDLDEDVRLSSGGERALSASTPEQSYEGITVEDVR